MKINMTDKQFATVWGGALVETDRDRYIGEWATSSLFYDPDEPDQDDENMMALAEQLAAIWDVAHMPMAEIRAASGLSQVRFAEHLCTSRRTVENWEANSCPGWTRLLLAEKYGFIQR